MSVQKFLFNPKVGNVTEVFCGSWDHGNFETFKLAEPLAVWNDQILEVSVKNHKIVGVCIVPKKGTRN